MKISSLNGNEIIVGDNMNIPSANSTFATTKSSTINGTNTIKPISNAVFNSLMINAGAKYAVIAHIITPDAIHPLAIEYVADKATSNVVTEDGEGYISTNGSDWEDVKGVIDCNLCIKAFSKNR